MLISSSPRIEHPFAPAASGHGPGAAPATPRVAAPRIIIIDDEADLLEVLGDELTEAGFDVTAVDNGRAALDAARHKRFDVALTDLKMPDMDGLQIAEALKEIDHDLPIIMATGYASDAALLASESRGIVVGLLQKPFGLDQVLDAVRRATHGNIPPTGEN